MKTDLTLGMPVAQQQTSEANEANEGFLARVDFKPPPPAEIPRHSAPGKRKLAPVPSDLRYPSERDGAPISRNALGKRTKKAASKTSLPLNPKYTPRNALSQDNEHTGSMPPSLKKGGTSRIWEEEVLKDPDYWKKDPLLEDPELVDPMFLGPNDREQIWGRKDNPDLKYSILFSPSKKFTLQDKLNIPPEATNIVREFIKKWNSLTPQMVDDIIQNGPNETHYNICNVYETDLIYGRGPGCYTRKANQLYKQQLTHLKSMYAMLDRGVKKLFVQKAYATIKSLPNPPRFLSLKPGDRTHYAELPAKETIKKISQFFREGMKQS